MRFVTGAMKLFVVVAVLFAFGAGLAYVRLLHSPISARMLIGPIERAIGAGLADLTVRIEDVELATGDGNLLELRVKNMRLVGPDGKAAAEVPRAAVELSTASLLLLDVQPRRLDLIEPSFNIAYRPGKGMSLSLNPGPLDAPASGSVGGPASGAPAATATDPAGESEATAAARGVIEMLRGARRQSSGGGLEQVGVRNASVILDNNGIRSVWRILGAELSLQHHQKRSVLVGEMRMASDRSPWTIGIRAEESDKTKLLSVELAIANVVPEEIGRHWPGLGVLRAIELPMSGKATIEIDARGEIIEGTLSIGSVEGSVSGARPPVIDQIKLAASYASSSGRVSISPSTLASGASRITFVGEIAPRPPTADAPASWSFVIAANDGVIAADTSVPTLPVERLAIRGTLTPESNLVRIDEMQLQAGKASVAMAGDIWFKGERVGATLEARSAPMSVATFRALWPAVIAPKSRKWVAGHVGKAQIESFVLKTEPSSDTRPGAKPLKAMITAEISGVEVAALKWLPMLDIPRLLIRIDGPQLDMTAPEGRLMTGPGRIAQIRALKVTSQDLDVEVSQAELILKGNASVASALDLIERHPASGFNRASVGLDSADGRVEGQARFKFPMVEDIDAADVRIEGSARVSDGRVRNLVGKHDVQSAAITFEFTDKAIDAKGQFIVAGVPARLGWKHIIGVPPDRQPEMNITATLDNGDRTQLGIDTAPFLTGETKLDVSVLRSGREAPTVHVNVDLTQSELAIDGLGWKKPVGIAARMDFDVARGRQNRIELQNLKVTGGDIAIEGWVGLGPDNKPREFHFPEFSVQIVSQLEVRGTLKPDNVWDLKVTGARFDGRNVFKSMLAAGRTSERPAPPAKDRAGLDMTAEIGAVLGFNENALKGLKLRLSRRGEHLTALDMSGTLSSGEQLLAQLQRDGQRQRLLRAQTSDGGNAFKLIGFYPNMIGGLMQLEVDLDGRGAADKTGTLWVRNFLVLGDQIVSDFVATTEDGNQPREAPKRPRERVVRQQIEFELLRVPFSIGHGQFVLHSAQIRGPLIGATLRGKLDFMARQLALNGTYIPLSGINRALSGIPILGDILTPKGEGVFGITFAIEGSMERPVLTANPMALIAPGIFREIFQMGPEDTRITPRETPAPKARIEPRGRASSVPPTSGPPPASAPSPDSVSGWTSGTETKPRSAPASPKK
ncbi:MAG TPA: AsmA-like C-terminal region-containing protein [Hyphomicrobiaceae bacterium]|nr:AsmA-like C-terminal region-containing protein [Hyphomicrobiaceae bacterium]